METEMTTEKARTGKWRVLVVDDEEAARYGIRRALGGDYDVKEAGSVEEAPAALPAAAPREPEPPQAHRARGRAARPDLRQLRGDAARALHDREGRRDGRHRPRA